MNVFVRTKSTSNLHVQRHRESLSEYKVKSQRMMDRNRILSARLAKLESDGHVCLLERDRQSRQRIQRSVSDNLRHFANLVLQI